MKTPAKARSKTARSPARQSRPPVVRLPPKSNVDIVMGRGSQLAVIGLGIVGLVFALIAGKFLLAPVTLAIVIGLMLGPVATRMERAGLPHALSALGVTLLFILIIAGFVAALAAPLAMWIDRLPQIWADLQSRLSQLREPLEMIKGIRDQLKSVMGSEGLAVSVEGDSPVTDVALMAPSIGAQFLLFLASLYFFVATRDMTRQTILRMCIGRRLRWRVAHIFRDVEWMVSQYLLSIAVINVGLGVATGLALWAVGVPQPFIWGALAGILNFVPFVGPAILMAALIGVGLASYDSISAALMPTFVALALHTIESQFVTPLIIGRAMTLNPFVVILALAFWIWIWGPIGGFIAIPALLILFAITRNILPGVDRDIAK